MAAPRGAPPVPHQARAPYLSLTPSVPEPSMFFPSSQSFSTPARPGSANSSLGPPCPRPPVPTAAPSQHLLRPQSEFSRVFHQVNVEVLYHLTQVFPFCRLKQPSSCKDQTLRTLSCLKGMFSSTPQICGSAST